MPSSAAAWAIRMAISPRLAISSFLSMSVRHGVDPSHVEKAAIVAHAPSENTLSPARTVERGALGETVSCGKSAAPLQAGPDDVLAAQA